MNSVLVFVAIFLHLFKDYTYKAEAATPSKSGSSTQVASSPTWLDLTHRRPDSSNTSPLETTPFKGPGSSSTPFRSDGDESTVEMLLVQAAEQTSRNAVRLMLQPLGEMHRYPLRPWTEVTTRRIDKIDITKEVAGGGLAKSWILAAPKSDGTARALRLCRAFTEKENEDTQTEEAGQLYKLSRPGTGPTMADQCTGSNNHSDDGTCDGERRYVTADRACQCHRNSRSIHPDRGPDSDREGKTSNRTTAGHGENCETGLRQAGEKTQNAAAGTSCTQQLAPVMESIYRRISEALENVRYRLCQQGRRPGAEGHDRQGGIDRGQAQVRCGKGGQRSAGHGPSRRCGGSLRRDGGRSARSYGDIRGDPGQHLGNGDQPGCTSYTPADRAERAGQQEAENRSRRRRNSSWATCIWACSAPAFWRARQIDQILEVCQGQNLGRFQQEDYAVHQWTHSILTEPDFLSEWRASINALDHAFFLQNDILLPTNPCRSSRMSSRRPNRDLRVRFHHTAELYVGAEHEHYFQTWKIPSNVMVKNTSIFRPLRQPLFDESSFMSMGNHEHARPFGPHLPEDDRIIENDGLALDPNEMQQDAHDADHSSDEEGTFSTDEQINEHQDWFATYLFTVDQQPIPLRVDWNDPEAMHRQAARALGISHHDLLYLHHVRHAPQDLADAGVEALIGHRHGDLPQGSPLHLVLLDVEFHETDPMTQPEVVRRVVRLPKYIGRITLLHRLGLAEYCRTMQQSCILWCDEQVVSPFSARPIELSHGVHLRLAVPPGDSSVAHISTRCVATACHQGVTLPELCDRHALYTLGWYDTIIDHPIVPHRPDEDEVALLQSSVPALPTRPWFISSSKECPIDAPQPVDRAEDDVGAITREYTNTLDQEAPGGIQPRPGLDEQPEHVQRIMEQLEENGATEVEEEGPVLYVNTWYLSHPLHRSCLYFRTVRVTGEFGTWHQQFLRRWSDLLEEGQPVDFVIVEPQPPTTRMQPTCLPHLILLQRTPEDERAAVITTVDSRDPTASFQHEAHFLPRIILKENVITAIDRVGACYPQISDLQCMIWHGERQLPEGLHIMAHHGISLLVIIQDVTYMSAQAWDQDEDEATNFMQRSSSRSTMSHSLNPHAPAFRPGCPIIQQQTEFVQDLFVQWSEKTRHCREGEKSVEFAVWFVDHERQRLQCLHPRRVRLHEDYEHWEMNIKQVWREHVVHHEEHELTLVQPNPPDLEHDLAGHIIFIQNPHDSLVTNLWTLYSHDTTMEMRGPSAQIAGTTHEHVYMERIIEGLGYQMQCFQTPPSHHCEVWYGQYQLHRGRPWMGRSGMGILAHIRPTRPLGPILLQLTTILSTTQGRQTHGQVAHTHGPCEHDRLPPVPIMTHIEGIQAVEIIDGSGQGNLPNFIENEGDITSEKVQQELACWGHHVLALDCHPHNKYFCVTPSEEIIVDAEPLQHFLFCHQDIKDVHGCFAHSESDMLTENQMMQFLCGLEYSRAVIVNQERLTPTWTKILFSHQEPVPDMEQRPLRDRTPWPQPSTWHTAAPMIDLDQLNSQPTMCRLVPDFKLQDLRDFFTSANDVLCRDFQIDGLPDEVASALHPAPQGPLDLNRYDRLMIYTDGSSRPEGRQMPPEKADELGLADTWAFLVMGERYATEHSPAEIHALGWMAHPVRYDPMGTAYTGIQRIGSDQAERSAATFAGLWRLAQNTTVTTMLCTDSSTTGGQAFGQLGAADPDESFRVLRGTYQALQCALPPGHMLWHHTKAHAGDPYNEFVDFVAKAESRRSFHHRRQHIDLREWKHHLSYFWMVFGERYGIPSWNADGFAVPPPRLPNPTNDRISDGGADQHARSFQELECGLCIATANVQSLSKGHQGHGGKLHYIQKQMKDFHINCMGIQEARTERGMRAANDILVYASGANAGHLGVEIWINLEQPIGWKKSRSRSKEAYLHRSDFCVVYCDERRLLLRCDNQMCSFWLYNTHAPHSGRPLSERQEWWSQTQLLLQQHCDQDPLFWMMDANAAPGPQDGVTVLTPGFATSSSTIFLQEALRTHGLCLPATACCHVGDHHTWTAVDGQSEHCIDHIAVPQNWMHRCTWSQVLHDFDLAQQHDDHNVVALQMQWSTWVQTSHRHASNRRQPTGDLAVYTNEPFKAALQEYRPAEWHEDAESHAKGLVQHLQKTMKQHLPQNHSRAKKVYVTEDIWQMRAHKLTLRQTCKLLRRQIGREGLFQCFHAWRCGHKTTHHEETFNYGTTLRCLQVKHVCSLHRLKLRMRRALQISKTHIMNQCLDNLEGHTAASDLLRVLKPFIGPTNPKQQKKKQLPLIHDADHKPCTLPTEALGVWISFFQHMEGGQRVSHDQLRLEWVQELRNLRQEDCTIPISEVPSLVDLEIALRRVPSRKARGPDEIPGEVCHLHADFLAVNMYTQLMKVAIHGQEPLLYKGGRLVPAYKGKGDAGQVTSYRSLLISSHLGKTIHRSLRQHQAQVYEHFLQVQQLGGRRRVPVQLALHQARAFLRRAKDRGLSAGLLFLDLTEAFYRILREISMGGKPTDELLAFVLHRLNLPSDTIHDLHKLLEDKTALQSAGLSYTARNCIRAIHSNTHFWMQGQADVVATHLGTRPGDSFADLIFGFTWSVVLQKLQSYLEDCNIIARLPVISTPPFFSAGNGVDATLDMKSYLGPTWMDDLCLCVQGDTPQVLESRLGPAIGYLLDLCRMHLMTPNLNRGKTELLLSFRGSGSRQMKVKYYGPLATGFFDVICEHQMQRISVVKSYKHLGGQLHHTSDQHGEVRIKVATAHQAFNQHRKLIYHNDQIPLRKKIEIFNTLVVTKMQYGADSWVAQDARTMKKYETAVLKLYQRLLRWPHDGHHRTSELLATIQQPAPVVLLRTARLRYLVTLFQCGVPNVWHLLGEDQRWVQLVEEDMIWMWEQLHHSSSMQDPRQHAAQWFDILQHHPKFWKRLLKRACRHDILQRRKIFQVVAFHDRFQQRMQEFMPERNHDIILMADENEDGATYGCMGCQLRCRTKAGEGAHMFRKHQQQAVLRHFIDQTQCRVCLREFHTFSKMKAHLHYSEKCRRIIMAGPVCHEIAPGAGSRTDRDLAHQHDRCLPPIQAEGPRQPAGRHREFHDIDEALHLFLVEYVAEHTDQAFELVRFGEAVREWILHHAISWTRMTSTLNFFITNFSEEDATFFHVDLPQMQSEIARVLDPTTWPFLRQQHGAHPQERTIADCHQQCQFWSDTWEHQMQIVPKPFGRMRIVLHAFAGRRRLGDLQYYLEKDINVDASFDLVVVSLDIVINAHWRDATKEDTRRMWLHAIREKHVVGFVAGPPCETWSRVRGEGPLPQGEGDGRDVACASRGLPRVLRTLSELWGLSSLGIREISQILIGNQLLIFTLEAIVEIALAGSVGIAEHPAEPVDLEDAASIWRLPIMRVICQLPGVERIRFAQGLLGAKTVKPTEFLCVNLPSMMRHLHAHRVRTELPKGQSIGKNSLGQWRTSALKEYPPSMCKAMSEAILSVFGQTAATEGSHSVPEHLLTICYSMQVREYGCTFGPDYAR